MQTADRIKLFNALTAYDKKQSTKKGYNPYALGHYAAALSRTAEMVENGAELREAIIRCFLGRLQTALLKAVGESAATREESRF